MRILQMFRKKKKPKTTGFSDELNIASFQDEKRLRPKWIKAFTAKKGDPKVVIKQKNLVAEVKREGEWYVIWAYDKRDPMRNIKTKITLFEAKKFVAKVRSW